MAPRLSVDHCSGGNARLYRTRQRVVHASSNLLWNTTPAFSRRIFKRVLFTPSSYRINPLEKNYLENGSPFQITVHDKVVRCWKWGRGPGVILAHGWGGRGIQLHRFIEPLVGRGYSAITFDAPGHGDSQGNTSSYFEFTDTIRTFLASSNCHNIQGIIAYSMGAAAAVNSIVKEKRSVEAALVAPILRLEELLTCYFDAMGIPKPIYQNLIEEYEHQFGYSLHRDNPSKLMREIDSKILIVHDKNDSTVPYGDSKDISDRFQNVSLHTTEGLGHGRVLADRSVVDRIIDHVSQQAD